MPSTESLRAWLMLRAVQGLSDATLGRLVQSFGSPEAVLGASSEALMANGQVGTTVARAIAQKPDGAVLQGIDRELRHAERLTLSVVTVLDPDYPPRLRAIPDPPPLLYVTGALALEDQNAVAVVGARRATPSGRMITEELSRGLAAAGFTVVSGMARGIDAAAHRGALGAGGRTLAVLGCGIDRTYPPEHDTLRKQIERAGAVLSELPLGAPPHGYHFPRRNRLISGLSLGVVVTEAARQSGSLITARLAADQGREVFAVPGSVKEETSRGPHSLIKQGAKLVEQLEDIIEELLPQVQGSLRERLIVRAPAVGKTGPTPSEEEGQVYKLVSSELTHIDDLIARASLPVAQVTGLLLSLEIKGLIRQFPGPCYVRV